MSHFVENKDMMTKARQLACELIEAQMKNADEDKITVFANALVIAFCSVMAVYKVPWAQAIALVEMRYRMASMQEGQLANILKAFGKDGVN